MTESIHDLFTRVRQHPAFVGGTVLTTDDVSGLLEDMGYEPTAERIEALAQTRPFRKCDDVWMEDWHLAGAAGIGLQEAQFDNPTLFPDPPDEAWKVQQEAEAYAE